MSVQGNLMNAPVAISDGLDGIVVVNNYTAKRGGTTLDVAGYPLPNIRAGHVIIKDANNNFRPMPIVIAGGISALGAFTPGSGYTNPGTYQNVALTGGSGSGATADIVVTAGAVTSVTLKSAGTGYKAGETLSASAANIGTGGSGFAIGVTSTSQASITYGTLPGDWSYAGHAVNSVSVSKPFVGVMYHGEINDKVIRPSAGVFSIATIKSALKTALPMMMYTGDNV